MKSGIFQSLRIRLLGPLVLLLLFFTLIFGYLSWSFHREYAELSQKISLNSEVGRHAVEVTRIRAQIQQLLFGLKGKSLADNEHQLRALNASRTSHLARIRALTSGNSRWSSLGASMAGGIENASFLQFEMVKASKDEDPQRAELALRQLSTIFEINSSRLKDFTLHLENDLQENANELKSLLQQTFWIFLGVAALMAAGLWGIALLYRLHVLSPLQNLHQGLQSLSTGEMNSRIKAVPAPRELREMTEDFNKMVSSLQATQKDLTHAREAALSAAQIKSDFLANMSHEIRTPLNTIVGITDELTEMKSEGTQKEYTQILSKSAQVLLSIVNDILDFSKLEDGSITLARIPLDLNELTERISAVVAPMARKKGLEFNRRFVPEGPCWVLGDPKRIEQIILNLLGNAIKFTEIGKVGFNVQVSQKDNSAAISMTFSDTGAGIHESDRTHIFERFIQSDTSVTRKHGGTGLGLSIVKQLVNLMNGKISLQSELGKGSDFCVELELLRAQPSQVEKSHDPVPPLQAEPNTKKLILLVDDSIDNRTLIQIYLRDTPHELVMAENGQLAVSQFEGKKFDLILMDMQMPVMDGYEATRKIRRIETDKGLRRTRLIALSAYSMPEEVEKGRLAGCDDYLTKPIRKKDLLAVLNKD